MRAQFCSALALICKENGEGKGWSRSAPPLRVCAFSGGVRNKSTGYCTNVSAYAKSRNSSAARATDVPRLQTPDWRYYLHS